MSDICERSPSCDNEDFVLPFTSSSFCEVDSDTDDKCSSVRTCPCCSAEKRAIQDRLDAKSPCPARPPLNIEFAKVHSNNHRALDFFVDRGQVCCLVRTAAQVLAVDFDSGKVESLHRQESLDWVDSVLQHHPTPTSCLQVSFHILRPCRNEVHVFARVGRHVVASTFFRDTKDVVTPHVAVVSNIGIVVDVSTRTMIVVDKGWHFPSRHGDGEVALLESTFDCTDEMMNAARALSKAFRVRIPVIENGVQVERLAAFVSDPLSDHESFVSLTSL